MSYAYNYRIGFWSPVTGAYMPNTDKEAKSCWDQIELALSPECIHEDGELTQREARQKYLQVLEDAVRLNAKYPKPDDIYLDLWNEKDYRYFGFTGFKEAYDAYSKAKGLPT